MLRLNPSIRVFRIARTATPERSDVLLRNEFLLSWIFLYGWLSNLNDAYLISDP
jgi:hypothetical protein